MAKVYYEDYKWFVSLTYEQWTRSQNWITNRVLKNYELKIFTGSQVQNIWKYYEDITWAKVGEREARKTPPTPIIEQHTSDGDYIGSATATYPESSSGGRSWWSSFFLGPNFDINASAGENFKNSLAGPIPVITNGAGSVVDAVKGAGNWVVLAVMGLILILIIKK